MATKTKTYQINGKVVDVKNNRGIEGLTVLAWDKDLIFDDFLDVSVTDKRGDFLIEFDESDFKELIFDRHPDVFFQVLRGNEQILSTEGQVLWNVKSRKKQVTLTISDYWPSPKVKIDFRALKLNLSDIESLSKSSQRYIKNKLNHHLKSELLKYFPRVSQNLQHAIEKIRINYNAVCDLDFRSFAETEILSKLSYSKKLQDELKKFVDKSSSKTKISDLLGLDQPLKINPIFEKEVKAIETLELAKIAQLSEEEANVLIDRDFNPQNMMAKTWEKLSENGTVPAEKLNSLHVTSDLALLTDNNFELIRVLKANNSDKIEPLENIKNLLKFDKSDWIQLIEQNDIPTPDNTTTEEYADNIVFNLEYTYPSEFFLYRMVVKDKSEELQYIDNLEKLWENNEKLFDENGIADINWEGINPQERLVMENDLIQLNKTINAYKYLNIKDLVNSPNSSSAQKKDDINERLNTLNIFYQHNPSLDFKNIDFIKNVNYTHGGKSEPIPISWEGLKEEDQPVVRKQLMAYQRAMAISSSYYTSYDLLSHGFNSAYDVTNVSEEEFTSTSGMPTEVAHEVYQKALQTEIKVAHGLEIANDINYGLFGELTVGNFSPEIKNELKEIDGYSDLFGSQNYCNSSHCRSIFGPAAYFVDLMRFIDQKISSITFSGKEDHSLYLKNRRPDLWELPLTCENTNQLVPYIDISNEILENYVKYLSQNEDPYQVLKTANNSFRQPFNLPLTELRTYLKHFDLNLSDIFKKLKVNNENEIAREQLELSHEELNIITEPDTEHIEERYGNITDISVFPVPDFLNFTGLLRDELDVIIQFKNINVGVQVPENIKIIRDQNPDDINRFNEFLINLTKGRLDKIHRFVRLWRKLPWSLKELNLILESITNAGYANTLDEDAVSSIAILITIQETLNLNVEELCAFTFEIPNEAIQYNESMYFRMFGDLEQVEFYHAYFDHSNPNPNDTEIDKNTSRLLAGFGITENELLKLLIFLKDALGINTAGKFLLTNSNLSLLYRHVKLAKSLQISIVQGLHVISLCLPDDQLYLGTISDLSKVIKWIDQLKSIPFSLDELWLILNGEEFNKTKFRIAENNVLDLIQTIDSKQILYISTADLSTIDGISSIDASAIIEQLVQNNLIISVDDNAYKLSIEYETDVSLTELLNNANISDEAKAKENEIREVLNSHHPFKILPAYLSDLLSINLDKFNLLIQFTGIDLKDRTFIAALMLPVNNQDCALLIELIRKLEQTSRIFNSLKLELESIQYILDHPSIFKIEGIANLTLQNIDLISAYSDLLNKDQNVGKELHNYLHHYASVVDFRDEDITLLAHLLESDEDLIRSIIEGIIFFNENLSKNPIEITRFIKECWILCNTLGIKGQLLNQFPSTDYETLQSIRNIVKDAFRAKYEDEVEWETAIKPFEDIIRTIKRDKLSDFIIASQLGFKDTDDIYSYFLIDTEMDSCAKTSKVKAAISSLQLYVHRCKANLEQSVSDNIKVLPGQIPENELEWRKNYRIWEANRKVFLYPENWILPALRDNKTPIFKELEEELLQEKITLESAENAYRVYMNKFNELANLKMAGNYYDEPSHILYLFGHTTDDPPQYYMRKCIGYRQTNQPDWTPWEKVTLTINSKKVSPITYRGKLYLFWLETLTKPTNNIIDGNSIFVGYNHKVTFKCASQNLKGDWTIPVSITLNQIEDPLAEEDEYIIITPYDEFPYFTLKIPKPEAFTPRYDSSGARHFEPIENYSLIGYQWERIYPYSHNNQYLNFYFELPPFEYDMEIQKYFHGIDFFEKTIEKDTIRGFGYLVPKTLVCVAEDNDYNLYSYSYSLWYKAQRYHKTTKHIYSPDESKIVPNNNIGYLESMPNIEPLNINRSDFVVEINGDSFLTKYAQNNGRLFIAERLGTTVGRKITKLLYTHNLDEFLSIYTQQNQHEDQLPIESDYIEFLRGDVNHIDFSGPCGNYYWELYYHIPSIIADHLNANQKFEEAQKWYHYIFNPTTEEEQDPDCPTDHNWQFIKFRGNDIPSLKELLNDHVAIEEYKKDPFNPHAIARLRLSAYQKASAMKYIDNLLDWGDYLFTQDTMESINEAMMIYITAFDVLGKRPAELGECELFNEEELTYDVIASSDEASSEFIIYLENFVIQPLHFNNNEIDETLVNADINLSYEMATNCMMSYEDAVMTNQATTMNGIAGTIDTGSSITGYITRENRLAFGVPPNDTLLSYWDRVEDRLYKIRNCMNIKGIRRELPLFQPPIDPGMLVKAKAAGLSLEDIVGTLTETIPPYRFSYLVEKAKGLTATVQGFGSSLLSALEKKNVEELTLLNSMHEQNILKLTTQIKRNQLKESRTRLESIKANKVNIENRLQHYEALINTGLIPNERTEQIMRHSATGLRTSALAYYFLSSALHLLPQVGSPFAMKYGGKEAGDSVYDLGSAINESTNILNSIAASAGLEAGYERREEEWQHQLKLTNQEMIQMDKEIAAAEIRVNIAERELEIHDKTAEQRKETYEFYKDKFTRLGLYDWMAANLTKLYRQAYNMAYELAMSAEKSYHFERDDDTRFIESNNWEQDKAGLLSGEKLMLQLHQMENAFLQKNVRDFEMNQSFSLTQFDPEALISLRENGTCEFELPEWGFDLYYPGQYKRMVKSISLTIPCVTGPYTNVSCKLSLTTSKIRKEPQWGAEYLITLPNRTPSLSIATSKANNDSGTFELNFSDERYMPFEGAGAVSTWRLNLPNKVRSFNYDTISDIIVHMNYTAREDGIFREKVEEEIENSLIQYAEDQEKGLYRLIDINQEFSNNYHQLLYPPAGEEKQQTVLHLTQKNFPYFLRNKLLTIKSISLYFKLKGEFDGQISLVLEGESESGQSLSFDEITGLWKCQFEINEGLDQNMPLVLSVANSEINNDDLVDIYMLIQYTIE